MLSYLDSNQDKQNQNLLCYHYTIGQSSVLSFEERCKGSSFWCKCQIISAVFVREGFCVLENALRSATIIVANARYCVLYFEFINRLYHLFYLVAAHCRVAGQAQLLAVYALRYWEHKVAELF